MINLPKIAVRFIADGILLELADSFTVYSGTLEQLTWLDAYLSNQPIQIPFTGSSFQQQVLRALSLVPFGRTISYSQLAANAGNPKAARAVGNTCHHNHYPLLIPCHRIIQSNGKIGGYAFDLEIKRRLLEFERGKAPRKLFGSFR